MSDARPTLLAIDAGQTGIRARLDHEGESREFGFTGIRTDRPLIPQLAGVAVAVAEEAGVDFDTVSCGVSGLTPEQTEPETLLSALRPFRVRTVNLAHDSVTAYLGALGHAHGVVVAAGTGVVTYGVGAAAVARVDGWGYLIGDAGSGYWIGRAALDAVMRAHDGRGPATALTEVALAEFPNLESAYITLQSDDGRVRRIAAYSARVAELASTDAVAADILVRAGRELAASALTALGRVGELANSTTSVRGIGGVFRSPELNAAFEAAIRAELPDADIQPGVAHPLDGAALLPTITADSPLHAQIAIAAA